MLRVDRICVYILMFGLIMIIPSIMYIKFVDELCTMLFSMIAVIDCVFNNNWRKYSLLWIIMAIMSFYAIYSLIQLNNNLPIAIAVDWIIELKPFIPFCVFLAVSPTFKDYDKNLIKKICIFNSAICSIAFILGIKVVELIVYHPAFAGAIIFASMMLYLYCSLTPDGKLPQKARNIITIFLTLGILCLRSKYYGEYILAIFFLYIYKPGMMRHFNAKHAVGVILLIAIIAAAAWQKFSYYFLTGNSDSFDPEAVETFARPALYFTGLSILFDHFPFGTGLASFASYGSAEWYSNVYYEYGINNVFGLSEREGSFICDAFYPSLAQFGVIGLILFIWFWMYAYNFLRQAIRVNPKGAKNFLVIGALIICFILIECVGGTIFTQSIGMIVMALLGICCAQARKLVLETSETKINSTELQPELNKI